MEKIWELFQQLHAIPTKETDLKTYQEINVLIHQLRDHFNSLGEKALSDLKCSMDFFADADLLNPFLFGQCGDGVYWKIVDEVLYINGEGPMWNFNNSPIDYKKNYVFSPWCNAHYHTVVILDGVTTIGSDAFNSADISSIVIPSSVKKIEEMAFFNARIEHLILPNSIETIGDGILNGFSRVVDTLVVSVDIPDIKPYAFFNRDDILASNVYLTGSFPNDFTKLIESCLFDDAGRYPIYYPQEWDTENASFFEGLSHEFDDSNEAFLQKLKDALKPYRN